MYPREIAFVRCMSSTDVQSSQQGSNCIVQHLSWGNFRRPMYFFHRRRQYSNATDPTTSSCLSFETVVAHNIRDPPVRCMGSLLLPKESTVSSHESLGSFCRSMCLFHRRPDYPNVTDPTASNGGKEHLLRNCSGPEHRPINASHGFVSLTETRRCD